MDFDAYLSGTPNAAETKYGPAPTPAPAAVKKAPAKKGPARKAAVRKAPAKRR